MRIHETAFCGLVACIARRHNEVPREQAYPVRQHQAPRKEPLPNNPTASPSPLHSTNPPQTLAESLVLSSTTPSHTFITCALRSAPIFGPNDPILLPSIHSLIPHSTPFILGRSAQNLQDYVYITNIADAHVLAVNNLLSSQTAAGHAFYISNGEPIPLRDLCLSIWARFGHFPRWEIEIPEGVAWWMGLGAEVVEWVTGWETALSRGIVDDACRDRYVSCHKAMRILGYRPRVGLEEGIRKSCEWYKGVLARRGVGRENGGWS